MDEKLALDGRRARRRQRDPRREPALPPARRRRRGVALAERPSCESALRHSLGAGACGGRYACSGSLPLAVRARPAGDRGPARAPGAGRSDRHRPRRHRRSAPPARAAARSGSAPARRTNARDGRARFRGRARPEPRAQRHRPARGDTAGGPRAAGRAPDVGGARPRGQRRGAHRRATSRFGPQAARSAERSFFSRCQWSSR